MRLIGCFCAFPLFSLSEIVEQNCWIWVRISFMVSSMPWMVNVIHAFCMIYSNFCQNSWPHFRWVIWMKRLLRWSPVIFPLILHRPPAMRSRLHATCWLKSWPRACAHTSHSPRTASIWWWRNWTHRYEGGSFKGPRGVGGAPIAFWGILKNFGSLLGLLGIFQEFISLFVHFFLQFPANTSQTRLALLAVQGVSVIPGDDNRQAVPGHLEGPQNRVPPRY